ncbi:MAG: M18 family aminopeptidase, partial [Clostridia bacterium]|nr:M18 family aminopeptidase [Clostridia bacterium]
MFFEIENYGTLKSAVEELCAILNKNGFTALSEFENWNIQPGGRYYVTRNRSSVIAFTVPQCGLSHFQIVASHSDSPVFKLK